MLDIDLGYAVGDAKVDFSGAIAYEFTATGIAFGVAVVALSVLICALLAVIVIDSIHSHAQANT